MADATAELTRRSAGGFNFTVKDKTGAAINITGWAISYEVRPDPESTEVVASLITPGGVLVTDGPNGKGRVVLTDIETATIPVGTYIGDLFRETPLPRAMLCRVEHSVRETANR